MLLAEPDSSTLRNRRTEMEEHKKTVQSEESTLIEGSQTDELQEDEDRSILRSMKELGYIDIGLDI